VGASAGTRRKMQRSSRRLWRRTIRSSTQNSPSTVRGSSMSSQPSKHRARLNLRLHPRLQPESPGQSTGARRGSENAPSIKKPALQPPLSRPGVMPSAGGERVVSGILLRRDLGGLRLAFDGAGEGFLGGAIVEVLDLLVVLGFPMDEYANGDEEIVGLVRRDDAFGDGVGNRLGHRMLSGAKHLHRLARVLNGHLVVQDRRRLTHKVRRDQRE